MEIDIAKVKQLIELINETGIGEIEICEGDQSVRITRTVASATQGMIAPQATIIPAAPTAETKAPEKPDNSIVRFII